MTENEGIVNSLEAKIKNLIFLYEQSKNETIRLKTEKNDLEEAIRLKDHELKELQEKHEQLKLAKVLVTGSEDIHEAKLKVNRIVREVDKCIALLNK
ncbi:MAG: hypothetical protein Q8928_06495 [Bacteroidota bacterium]|nr:hypothetical protein [Bacteroidota bacterium]